MSEHCLYGKGGRGGKRGEVKNIERKGKKRGRKRRIERKIKERKNMKKK